MESLFQGPVDAVCDLAVRQLQAAQQQGRADPCSMVLLVGGFARSSYLQARVRAAVLGSGLADQVVVPPAPHAAVLGDGDDQLMMMARGQVLWCSVPCLALEKSCCPYVPGAPGKFFHLEDKSWYTNSLFVPYVEKNEMVARDHEVVHELQPLYRSSDEVQLQLYATDESNTTWVDDDKMGQSVQQLCKLRTALPSYATNADRTIHLR
ncbi:uncharacterized protein HaLaN_15112 [Haematococcus lacustris]|uniref:Uncharacterized protein n=1 Tax=Haematococcus lacustris TaxID=44745 RepID=A0A699ZFZ9_HAELA|nr:uncharacterized protein HaLaN_15112 [Haematococcus lacustris]